MVLELTLKHVKALTNLIDQQQQKILALQSGLQAGECPCLARISGGAGAGGGGGSSTDREPAGPAPALRNIPAPTAQRVQAPAGGDAGLAFSEVGLFEWAAWGVRWSLVAGHFGFGVSGFREFPPSS